jgi:hypothetical protein
MPNPSGLAVRAKDGTPVFLPLKTASVNASIVDGTSHLLDLGLQTLLK